MAQYTQRTQPMHRPGATEHGHGTPLGYGGKPAPPRAPQPYAQPYPPLRLHQPGGYASAALTYARDSYGAPRISLRGNYIPPHAPPAPPAHHPPPADPPPYKKIRITHDRPPSLSQPHHHQLRVDTREPVNSYNTVEVLSPNPPSEPTLEDQSFRTTKDELLQQISKVDREMALSEATLAKLKKKHQELEQTATKPAQAEEPEETPTRHRSLAQCVYAENRKKALSAHAVLSHLGTPVLYPLYNQPQDAQVYHENIRKHRLFRKRLADHIQRLKLAAEKREDALTDAYSRRAAEWLRRVERIEQGQKRKAKDAKNREFFEKVFPELRKQREERERFHRLGARVKSEAELEEIADGLHEQEHEDKKMRSLTVVPPLRRDPDDRRPIYIDTNRRCMDMESEHKQLNLRNVWSSAEKEVFRDKYLQHPKNFGQIASFLPRKSVRDCVRYYYLSKKAENYKQLLRKPRARRLARARPPPEPELPAGVTTRLQRSQGTVARPSEGSKEPSMDEALTVVVMGEALSDIPVPPQPPAAPHNAPRSDLNRTPPLPPSPPPASSAPLAPAPATSSGSVPCSAAGTIPLSCSGSSPSGSLQSISLPASLPSPGSIPSGSPSNLSSISLPPGNMPPGNVAGVPSGSAASGSGSTSSGSASVGSPAPAPTPPASTSMDAVVSPVTITEVSASAASFTTSTQQSSTPLPASITPSASPAPAPSPVPTPAPAVTPTPASSASTTASSASTAASTASTSSVASTAAVAAPVTVWVSLTPNSAPPTPQPAQPPTPTQPPPTPEPAVIERIGTPCSVVSAPPGSPLSGPLASQGPLPGSQGPLSQSPLSQGPLPGSQGLLTQSQSFSCAVCALPGATRTVSRSRLVHYGLKEDAVGSRVCEACHCRCVRSRYTRCPVATCPGPRVRAKRLRHLPPRWHDLSTELKRPLMDEFQIPSELSKCCLACFKRITRRLETIGDGGSAPDPTEDEVSRFRTLIRDHGTAWDRMATSCGRTPASLKAFYFTYRKKFQLDALVPERPPAKGSDTDDSILSSGDTDTASADSPRPPPLPGPRTDAVAPKGRRRDEYDSSATETADEENDAPSAKIIPAITLTTPSAVSAATLGAGLGAPPAAPQPAAARNGPTAPSPQPTGPLNVNASVSVTGVTGVTGLAGVTTSQGTAMSVRDVVLNMIEISLMKNSQPVPPPPVKLHPKVSAYCWSQGCLNDRDQPHEKQPARATAAGQAASQG